jgi:hypothetical protein
LSLAAAAGFFAAGFDAERLRAASASVARKFPLINRLVPLSKIPIATRRLKRMKAPHSLPAPRNRSLD